MNQKEKLVNELHKSARRNFQRRRFINKGLNDTFQADLVEMIPYAKQNKNFKYLLTVIDTFSKFAWAIPVKNKNAVDVVKAMQSIFKTGRVCKNLQTDHGKEFYNKNFKELMSKYTINHYSTFTHLKASIVERFNRTLKGMMWKHFSLQGSYKWLTILPSLMLNYNSRTHRTIKMKPTEVNDSNEHLLLNSVYNNPKIVSKSKYKIGQRVRISKWKHVFDKGYTPNWTTEIFKIAKIQCTYPTTYKLEDYKGNSISGGFYEYELQLANEVNTYLVEKIIRRKKNKVYVKWLGFDTTHNSWIDKKDILQQ